MKCNASIVLYNTPLGLVNEAVHNLRACPEICEIYLIDNSPRGEIETMEGVKYIHNRRNLGYGRAHNIAIKHTLSSDVPLHLVLNADVHFTPQAITQCIKAMEDNPDYGQLMPKIYYPNGEVQHLCKLLPSPLDLFGRRFLSRKLIAKRLDRFEMRPTGYNKPMDVPYLSGCFMLLRCSALRKVGLFDEHYFLYPEDIDLTRRIHRYYRTMFFPDVEVIHDHRQESYHSWKMAWIHFVNMACYFNKWGWNMLTDKERKAFNKRAIEENFPADYQYK
ncbi:MAG: glycosyltransferase family 2 protein [Paludibacteraceae bacterium]|nr:glycosyltransferase family 2 protein [Paludibacteraceae bacterium]